MDNTQPQPSPIPPLPKGYTVIDEPKTPALPKGFSFADEPEKKKTQVSSSGVKPSFPGSGVFQTQQSTAKPVVLTNKGTADYDKQVKDGIAKTERLSQDLQKAQTAYQSAQGVEASKSMQQAQEIYSAARLASSISADRERSGNRFGYIYNHMLKGIGGAASGVADAAMVLAEMLPTGDTEIESGALLKDYRENLAPIVREYLKDGIGADVDKGREKKFDDEFVTSALGGLAYSAPAMVTPYGIGLYSQAYDTGLESVNGTEEGRKLSEGQKTLYAGLIGGVVGLLEKTGLERIFGKSSVSQRAIDGLVVKAVDAAKRDGIKLSSDYFENFIGKEINSLSAKLLRSGKNVGEASVIEGITGGLQELATIGSERITNALTDKDIFDTQSLGEMTGRVLKASAAEALGGGILGGVKSFQNSSTKSELINRIASVKSFEDNRNLLIDIEQAATDLGLNEDEIADITNSLDQYQKIIERLPAELPAEAKAKIIPLVEEREDIIDSMKGEVKKLESIDPAFQPQQAAKIEALNDRVKEINGEISKGADIVNSPEPVTTKTQLAGMGIAPDVKVNEQSVKESQVKQEVTPFKMYDRDQGILGKNFDVEDENIFLLDENTGNVVLNEQGYQYGYSDPRYYWGDLFNIDFDLGDKPNFKDLKITPAKLSNNGKLIQKGSIGVKSDVPDSSKELLVKPNLGNTDTSPSTVNLPVGEGSGTQLQDAQSKNQGSDVPQIESSPESEEVLDRAELDLTLLKSVKDKQVKFDASMKRLDAAFNSGIISEPEYADFVKRFSDVIAPYKPKKQTISAEEQALLSNPEMEIGEAFSIDDEISVPEENKSYHETEKSKALADIKAQWQKLGIVGIADDPVQRDQDIAKLFSAVSLYVYHGILDGSIKLKGRISDKVDEIIRTLRLSVTDEQYEKITDIVKVQAERAKADVKKMSPTVKSVIKQSTEVKSDFKERDVISRLSQLKRRLSDEMRGFRKGVKEGKSTAKEIQAAKDDIINGLRTEIRLQIRDARDKGLISGKIRSSTFTNAVNRINNAKTPLQLLGAIDYMSRVISDVNYDANLATANRLRDAVKNLAKRKGLPANIVSAMRNIARAVPSELSDIKTYNELLSEVIANINGTSISGINTSLLNDAADYLAEQKQKQVKERYELLVGNQDGFGYEEKTLSEMKAEIDELMAEDYTQKDNRRDADNAVSELLREDLLDADLSGYTHPQEIEAINALKTVELSGLTDKELRLFILSVQNILINGKLNGIGSIISVARKQKFFNNKALISDVQRTTRAVSATADGFRKDWATSTTQLKSFLNNERALSKYSVIIGLSDIRSGYTRVASTIDGIEKRIERIIRSNKSLRDNPKEQIQVAVFADLNQYEEGSTQEDIKEQFEGRKIALLETIDRLRTKSERDITFKKLHANYIKQVQSVYDEIKDYSSIDDIKLNPRQRELYTLMRNHFDSIQEDTRLNAEIFNNLNFSPITNYFPRTYNKIDDLFGANAEKQMRDMLYSESVFYNKVDLNREESGSKKERTIKKGQLPTDKVINLDLVSNFLNTARNIQYDINTQSHRHYASSVLASTDMRELTKDDSAIEITQRVVRQVVKNQRIGILPQHAKSVSKALKEFYRGTGNRFALGGGAQAIKQSAATFTTTVAALGSNSGLLARSIQELIFNNQAANKLMAPYSVSRRSIEKSALTHVSIKESDVSKLNRSLEKHIVRGLDSFNDFADFMSLSPLIWGDLFSAKLSWLSFYQEYLVKEGIVSSGEKFDLKKEAENPNQFAAEYAESCVNLQLNISDRTQQPQKKIIALFPFTSFALNSKINLAVDMARVARKDIPMDDRIRSARMVAGHIASSIVLNSIAWGVRLYMLSEAVDLIQGFIDSDDKEDEKKKVSGYLKVLKEEMFVRNSENTRDYLIKDIIFGGMLSQFTDPIYSYFKELKTGEEEYARPSDLVSMLGIYGIPIKAVIQLGEKADNYMVGDEQFLSERFGIEAADGSMLYIPKDDRNETRPDWARKSMAFSLALNSLQVLSSVSSQEMGAVSRRIPSIIKKLEDRKYGAKRKFKIEAVEKHFSEISRDGVTYILNAKQIEFRRQAKEDWLNDWYETIKDADSDDKESEQTARERSNKFSADQVIFEYGLDGLKRKE